MLQSNEGDSLSLVNDEALFGSGSASWNAQSESPPRQANGGENQVIHNRLNGGADLHMDGIPGEPDKNIQGAGHQQDDRGRDGGTVSVGARPKVNNSERTEQQVHGNRDRTRNKTIKDKENKNRNSNIKKNNIPVQNGWAPAVKNSNVDSNWVPRLQLVDYNNPQRKNGNSVKQKKQTMNLNSALVQGTPEDQICANDVEGEADEFLRLPAGLDPYSDPSQISQVYVRANRPGHVMPPNPIPLQSGVDSNSLPSIDTENVELQSHTPVKRIHNNLWENSKNCNVRELSGLPNGTLSFRNDVEVDSENLQLSHADLPVFTPQSANSRLGSEQIVQHFPGNNRSISHNRNSPSNSPNLSLSGESQITVPYDVITEGPGNNMPINLDNLHSNLPTDFLFGDGSSDFYYAQQLQLEFDKENADLQIQRQFDDVSNYDYLNLSPDQRAGLPTRIVNNTSRNDFRRDPVMNDVYDPSSLGDGLTDSLFITCHNGESPEITAISPDIRYDLPTQPDPSLSPSNSHCLRMRGSSLEDENLARYIAEELRLEEDERLARHLQEQDAMEERRYGLRNHGNRGSDVNEYRENSEPLYARFNRTWHRPLTVSTSGRSNNVMDSTHRGQSSTERPLTRRPPIDATEFEYLEGIHSPSEYRMFPSNLGRYEFNPDYMLDDYGEDLVSISRDPRMLATLLMERAPGMMIPNEIDLNDYEALWELAEGLGEVKRVGMEHTEMTALPVHVYQGQSGADDNKTDCLVCLSEFKKGEQLRTLPCCHFYHVDCIDEWLKRNAVCPVCRQSASQRH